MMGRMAERHERTLTAQIAPFGGAEAASTPVLLLAGRAGSARMAPTDRMILPGRSLDIGRRQAGGPSIAPGALLLDDPLASSRHARFLREGDGWAVTDLGSKNGTLIDGQKVAGLVPIADGARLFVGGHVYVFRIISAVQLEAMRAELAEPLGPVATTSPRLATLCARLRKLAAADTEILLVGETGVGKEVYARAIHASGGRRGRFVALNCAAIPRELVESELFGYRPGAHSTAQAAKPGLIEESDGGTLFLDEVGEMNPEVQTKLLRFLQDRELTPLGGTRPRKLDVRIVAATNRDVAPGAPSGLRDDLLGRLGASPIRIPPLRDRIEDLGALTQHLLDEVARQGRPVPPGLAAPALRALALARFPLNVRELQKAIVSAAALAAPGALVQVEDLPEGLFAPPASVITERLPETVRAVVVTPSGRKAPEPAPAAEVLERLLRLHEGNVADVARALGRQRAAIWRWIKRYGINPEKFRTL
jgi:transcriptional regulator with PAS, ATPase and Fis domain